MSYNVSTRDWSLVSGAAPGSVTLPTIANHIAVFTNATGNLADDVATAIQGGNLQAGLSGTAGYLASYPATAARGSLRFVAANSAGDTVTQITNASQAAARTYTIPAAGPSSNFLMTNSGSSQTIATGSLALTLGGLTVAAGNIAATLGSVAAGTTVTGGTGVVATTGNVTATTGNIVAGSDANAGELWAYPFTTAQGIFKIIPVDAGGAWNTIISNSSMGQSSTFSIPDPASATATFVVKTNALSVGNVVMAGANDGVVDDAGFLATDVQLKTQVKAAQTADIGGGGAGPINVVVADLTGASVVVASILSSSNTVAVAKVDPGAGSFDITFTGDPGAACVVNYVAYIAAQ